MFDFSINLELQVFWNGGNICYDVYSKIIWIQARHSSIYINRDFDNPLQRLVQHGAKYIVVADIFPIGCLPATLTKLASPNNVEYDRHGCLKSVNRLGRYQNSLLRQQIKMLRYKYPHTKIVAAEYFKPFLAFLDMPGHFGLNSSATLLTCCGAGGPPYNYDFNAGCGRAGVTACANPSQALQWDGFHLTESAYRAVADGWLHGPYADPPIMHIAR